MAYVTALLVVLTLTGQPVVNALCIDWCDSSSERQDCDKAIAQPTSTTMSDGDACAALVTAIPFVRDDARIVRPGLVVLGVVDASSAPPAGGARLAHIGVGGEASAGRRQPLLVLRV